MAKKREPASILQRVYLARQKAEKGERPDDPAFAEQFPQLWELLGAVWLDETHRVDPAKIEISIATGDWLFRLNSPAMGAYTALQVPNFADGLASLERQVLMLDRWNFYLKKQARVRTIDPNRKNGIDTAGWNE